MRVHPIETIFKIDNVGRAIADGDKVGCSESTWDVVREVHPMFDQRVSALAYLSAVVGVFADKVSHLLIGVMVKAVIAVVKC